MSIRVSPINGDSTVCLIVCLDWYQRKHQSPSYWSFVRGIHRWPVDSPHIGPVTQKPFSFDDVIMVSHAILIHMALQVPVNPKPKLRLKYRFYKTGVIFAFIKHQEEHFRGITKTSLWASRRLKSQIIRRSIQRLFRLNETPNLRYRSFGRWIPSQRASNAETVSITWRHHGVIL